MLSRTEARPTEDEKKKRKALPKTLTSLPGWVIAQYVRHGSKMYGPYYYHFQRVGGKLRKRYIPPSELERYRTLTKRWREDKALLSTRRVAWKDGNDSVADFQSRWDLIHARNAAFRRMIEHRNVIDA